MAFNKKTSSASLTSPCADLRSAYHNCFNRWYSEKFVKGQWDKEECVSEWQKYRPYLSANREDEYARIEAAGGKVIQWNGHRVFGVLAMSRSIGDRYLKPWIIREPEVMFIPRAKDDDCLILASDGLWDVMTNKEACDLARRRILLWHKKNGITLTLERGETADPAAQDAAEYLKLCSSKRKQG